MNKSQKKMVAFKFYFWQFLSLIMIVIALGLAILLFFVPSVLPKGKEFETVVAVTLGYLALLYNLINYKIAQDKFFKELFTEFNARFDKLNEALNEICQNEATNNTLESSKVATIIDYLNLCAEEFLWYKKGRIEPDVWQSWFAGIRWYMSNKHINSILEKQKPERASYYGLIEELEK